MTLQTTSPGQAEGLLITGERNILSHVTVIGAGDALQANGRIYMVDSTIIGTGDTIPGRARHVVLRTLHYQVNSRDDVAAEQKGKSR